MLASRTERTLVEVAEVPWSPGFFSTDYLVLETSFDSSVMGTCLDSLVPGTSLDSSVLVTLVLVAVVSCKEEIVAAQYIVLSLVEGVSDGQTLPLNRTVPRLCWVCCSSSC